MYQAHPSLELQKAFQTKPYQGAAPWEASFLFIGLDANYAPDIDNTTIFSKVIEYHTDGVKFWKKYGVHHPFLLNEYTGDGKFYHKSFARIGIKSSQAEQISFIELLHKPTVGRNNLSFLDLVDTHLSLVEQAIFSGNARYVFIPTSVALMLRKTNYGKWLRSHPIKGLEGLDIWYQSSEVTVFKHLHFSVYGKFERQKQKELRAIGSLVADNG